MRTDRAAITRTIKAYHDVVAHRCAEQPGLAVWLRDDVEGLAELLSHACAEVGVPRADYEEALCEDPSLRELQKLALDEVLLEQSDPGPHAEISRESPAGTPENYHLHDWNGVSPPGGVGGSGTPRGRR
ncbi:MAG: hypothetical protein QM820_28220 [Minicystis sp.]